MYFKLTLPPGLSKDGTEYQSGGAIVYWWDQSLTRFYGNDVGPIGGWKKHSNHAFTGSCRAMMVWRAGNGVEHLIAGTEQGVFHQSPSGATVDITPAGFTAGAADSAVGTGYGGGSYGGGAYGVPRPNVGTTTEAAVWDVAPFGQIAILCGFWDGNLYEWNPPDTSVIASIVTNAPTSCLGCFVTNQRAVVAYGSGGDGRNVAWSDLEDRNNWTPASTNQAGDFDINSEGTIVKGLSVGEVNLIITTVDVHVMRYVTPPYVYGFQQLASGCGAMSKGCVVNRGQQVMWWGRSGFWQYDGGAVTPVQCDIADFLRTDVNPSQRAKITGVHNSDFSEVWWFYPSSASTENDSYCWVNYETGKWGRGKLARTCGVEKGVFEFPILCDPAGYTWEHEIGQSYDGAEVFIETGPIELGSGDQVVPVNGLIGDERVFGNVSVGFRTRDFPDTSLPETVIPQQALSANGYTEYRFAARQIKMRIDFTIGGSSRFGTARLDIETGGRR